MRQAFIAYLTKDLNFGKAALLAMTYADWDDRFTNPVLLAWFDGRDARMSPAINGANRHASWKDYGASNGGMLEVDVAGEYAFIYADSGLKQESSRPGGYAPGRSGSTQR